MKERASRGERGLTMRTVGWILLVFDALIVLFVFVGIRSGSLLWFWWAVIEGLVGAVLVLAGLHQIDLASSEAGHAVEPHVHAGEFPADEHRRAA
jgi:hypothetical protein